MKNTIEERQFAACESVRCAEIVAPVQMPVKQGGWVKQVFSVLYAWNERRVSRKLLHALSPEQLKDIGLARSDIDKEYPRSVWPNWPK